MEKKIYRNKRNENKYIELVHYGCGHYYAIQFMKWGNIVNRNGGNRRFRFTKNFIMSILEDYTLVSC